MGANNGNDIFLGPWSNAILAAHIASGTVQWCYI